MYKVLFGGCFDLFHVGHLRAIKKARDFGNYLVISVASDQEVRFKKGKHRPLVSQKDRMEILRSLKWVNEVVPQKGLYNIERILKQIKPDVLVLNKGEQRMTEELICQRVGVKVKRIDRQPSSADTTQLVKKLRRINAK